MENNSLTKGARPSTSRVYGTNKGTPTFGKWVGTLRFETCRVALLGAQGTSWIKDLANDQKALILMLDKADLRNVAECRNAVLAAHEQANVK